MVAGSRVPLSIFLPDRKTAPAGTSTSSSTPLLFDAHNLETHSIALTIDLEGTDSSLTTMDLGAARDMFIRMLQEDGRPDLSIANENNAVVVCGDRKWNVNRNILSAGSALFRTMLTHFHVSLKTLDKTFVYSYMRQEGTTGQITLEDDNPDAVQEMLFFFFYSQSYFRRSDNFMYNLLPAKNMHSVKDLEVYPSASKEWWIQHVEVYRVADKYGIVELKRLSESCILELLKGSNLPIVKGWEHLIQAIYDLELAGTGRLKVVAIESADNIKELASRGFEIANRTMGLEEPENFDVIRYLLVRNKEDLRQARAAHEGRLDAQKLESKNTIESLKGGIKRAKDLVRSGGSRARTAGLLAALAD